MIFNRQTKNQQPIFVNETCQIVVDTSPEAIVSVDPQMKIVLWNSTATKMFGYSADEVVGDSLDAFRAGRDIAPFIKDFRNAFAKGDNIGISNRLELTTFNRSDKALVLEFRISAFKQDATTIYTAFIQTVSSKEKTSDDVTRTFFQGCGEGFVVIDRQYRIVTANYVYCEQVKKCIEDIEGLHCYKVTRQMTERCDVEDDYCPVKHTFLTGKTHTCIHKNYNHCKQPMYVEIKSYPIKDKEGQVTFALQVITDVTKTIALENALKNKISELQASEEKFRKISATAQDAIIIMNQKKEISYWNSAAERIFGYKKEEMEGINLLKIIFADRLYQHYPGLEKIIETGEGYTTGRQFDLMAIKKDGAECPVELSLSTVKIQDKWNSVWIIKDVSKQKRAEDKIKKDNHIQRILNSILQISLEPITLQKQLERILDLILSLPWTALQSKGCIRLNQNNHWLIIKKEGCHVCISSETLCDKRATCGNDFQGCKHVSLEGSKDGANLCYQNKIDFGHYCIPIKLENTLLGFICLCIAKGYRAGVEEEFFLSSVANALAGIIQRKRAEEDLKKAKEELENRVKLRTSELTDVVRRLEHEIIEHSLTVEKLSASLDEKKALLREIHHRVKNNLQVISSLLGLQSEYIRGEKYYHVFKDSQQRIKTMALIHEKLYQSDNLANINFKEYVTNLTESITSSFGVFAHGVTIEIEIENLFFTIDTGIPCGLIINELVSNSLKHAFARNELGVIKIALFAIGEGVYQLIVSDNGVGLPEEIDIRDTESLGFQLITTLVEHQLQGKIELIRDKGTTFKIELREIEKKKRV